MGADFYLQDPELSWLESYKLGLPSWRKAYNVSQWVSENCPKWAPDDWEDDDSVVTGADLERLLDVARAGDEGPLGLDEANRVLEQLLPFFNRPDFSPSKRYRFVRSY